MQKLLFLTLLSCFSLSLFAQAPAKKEESDPAAKKVLEAMRKKYEAYGTVQADFTLTIEAPQQSTTSQQGTMIQQDEKYRLRLDGRTIVSDGTSVWLYNEKTKEVEINDTEEDGEGGSISSPKDLLRAYEWDKYLYVLSQEFSENGRVVQQIEFKPTDRDSDFSKIRLTIEKASHDIVSIKTFGKDGSRYTLTVNQLKPNAAVTASTFTFSKSECTDCHFEDLRLN